MQEYKPDVLEGHAEYNINLNLKINKDPNISDEQYINMMIETQDAIEDILKEELKSDVEFTIKATHVTLKKNNDYIYKE